MIRFAPIVGILVLIALAPSFSTNKVVANQSPAVTPITKKSTYVCQNGSIAQKEVRACVAECKSIKDGGVCLNTCMCGSGK